MDTLNKKEIAVFAKNVVEKLDFSLGYLTSDCGNMKVEITEECPIILRKDMEQNIVQINPTIAKKHQKTTQLFFIVWGFLAEYNKTDIDIDNEAMSLLNEEMPNWAEPIEIFVSDFCDVLSQNQIESNKARCELMINLIPKLKN